MNFISSQRRLRNGVLTLRTMIIGAGLAACGISSAAPPGPGAPPPAVDVAYMSALAADKAAVRGIAITAAGSVTADTEFWKSAFRIASSIACDSTGTWLAWFQQSDKRGTPAIAIATPGKAPVNVYVFNLAVLWTANVSDGIAWGRGCDGNPVLYFLANKGPTLTAPTLWVLDPFATGSQPKEVYATRRAASGLAVSPEGKLVALGDPDEQGNPGYVVLPMTCQPGSSLPVAAGPSQFLFALRYEEYPGWATSLDWSSDGQRLAVPMGRKVGNLLYDTELWVAELNYLAEGDSEQVSFGALHHVASGKASFPSWAPTIDGAACDRIAYSGVDGVRLVDVARPGFFATDCAIPSPVSLGGISVVALDWK